MPGDKSPGDTGIWYDGESHLPEKRQPARGFAARGQAASAVLFPRSRRPLGLGKLVREGENKRNG